MGTITVGALAVVAVSMIPSDAVTHAVGRLERTSCVGTALIVMMMLLLLLLLMMMVISTKGWCTCSLQRRFLEWGTINVAVLAVISMIFGGSSYGMTATITSGHRLPIRSRCCHTSTPTRRGDCSLPRTNTNRGSSTS